MPGVLPGSVREDAGDLPDARPRSGVDILRCPLWCSLDAGSESAASRYKVTYENSNASGTTFQNKSLLSTLLYRRLMVQALVPPHYDMPYNKNKMSKYRKNLSVYSHNSAFPTLPRLLAKCNCKAFILKNKSALRFAVGLHFSFTQLI